jgi:hypothetical protein
VSSRTIRRRVSLCSATRWGAMLPMEWRDRMEELLIDDDIATLKHHAEGMARTRTALAGPRRVSRRNAWRTIYRIRPSVATALRRVELCRNDGLHAPSTRQRGYQAWDTRWSLEVFASLFSSPGLRSAFAFAFGERPRSEVVRFRVDQLGDEPRVAPDPQGPSRRPCHGRHPDRPHEDRSRREAGEGAAGGCPSTPSRIAGARGHHEGTCVPASR